MTVYALDQVAVYVGKREVTAFGEGESFEISRSSELWENTAMTDGQIVSSKILDESAMATLRLRYDSPSNQVLQRMAESREDVDFSVAWPNGDTVDAEIARVQKYPDVADGQSPGDREWLIFLERAEWSYGVGA